MKVCFVLPGRATSPTGGYAVAYRYAVELHRRGHSVTILHGRTSKPGDGWKSRFAPGVYRLLTKSRPRWFEMPQDVEVCNVAPLLPKSIPHADVIVATGVLTAEPVALACERQGARGIYLIQHFEDFVTSPSAVRATWRLPLEKVVVSKWLHDLVEKEGLSSTVIVNGVDTKVFYPPAQRRRGEPAVMAMVSDVPWKRSDLVCEAFSIIAQKDSRIRLVTFGTCSRPQDLPQQAVHHRLPHATQLAGLYRDASVFMCASDSEGFGLPVAEAMACGVPVVSTDLDGIRSYAGEIPIYVRPGDSSSLARAALSLIDDEVGARKRSVAGLTLTSGMSADASAKRFAELCLNGAR